jgi:hypothetical protein
MSCCGGSRRTAGPTNPSAANRTGNGSAHRSPYGPSAGAISRASEFEYQGGRVLTVIGQGTGYRYQFVGYGARLPVDARDRASLVAVPLLREVH